MTGLPDATGSRQLVADATDGRGRSGFLGDPAVNVTRLNLAVAGGAADAVATAER